MICCGIQMDFSPKEYQFCGRCQKWKKKSDEANKPSSVDDLFPFLKRK